MYKLRPYQQDCVDACEKYLNGKSQKPVLVVAPTASGKSLMIASVANMVEKPVLVLQPSLELLSQNKSKCEEMGGVLTVYSAGAGEKEVSHLMYATLGSVKKMANQLRFLGIEVVLIDEAHFGYDPKTTSMFRKFIDVLKPKKVIGFTASPFRLTNTLNGAILQMITRTRPAYFKDIIHTIQIQDIVKLGFWSKLVYKEYDFNEEGLQYNSNGSNYSEESIKEVVKVNSVNNRMYRHIKDLQAEGKKSILVFIDSVENADIMAKNIPNCFAVSSETPKKLRNKIVEGFKSGEIQVVVNVNILTTGFDHPALDTILIGRPSNSLSVIYQIIGRGTRIHPDKKYCTIHDYCNNIRRFGKMENLIVEDVPGHGLAVTNNDVVLTGFPLSGFKVTKQEVLEMSSKSIVDDSGDLTPRFWFGKYQNVPLKKVPKWYVEFMLYKANFDWSYPKARKLKLALEELMEREKGLLLR